MPDFRQRRPKVLPLSNLTKADCDDGSGAVSRCNFHYRLFLYGCRPYGCDTDQCVQEGLYARAKHCYSVEQAGVQMMGDPRSRTTIPGDASALRSMAMEDMSLAFNQGRTLGLAPEAIRRDLERARIAYLRPFTSGSRRRLSTT
jgi:hypothetical protein